MADREANEGHKMLKQDAANGTIETNFNFDFPETMSESLDGYAALIERLRLYPTIHFTTFKNNRGLATKQFNYACGKISKAAHIKVQSGSAVRTEVRGVRGLRDFVNSLDTNTCLLWGVPTLAADSFEVTTKTDRKGAQISRSREYFKYADGAPGALMLDFDAPDGTEFESVDSTISNLFEAVPELRKFSYVVNLSCSALIYHGVTKLRGIGGFRMYFIVSDASNIPEVGSLIAQRLWLSGKGYIKVSSAGQLLERCLVDTSVWQPERCDFAARGVYADGLRTEAPKAISVEQDEAGKALAPALALRDLKPLTSAETQTYLETVSAEKAAWASQAAAAKEAWAADRAKPLAERKQIPVSQAHAILMAVLDGGHLPSEFELISQDNEVVTVADLLVDRKRWHKVRFLDPLDPGHRGGNDYCAVAYLDGVQPIIWSLAHGKSRYVLQTTRPQLKLAAGGRVAELEVVKGALLKSGVIVRNQVGELSLVEGATLKAFRSDGKALKLECMRLLDTVRNEKGVEAITDFPIGHAQDLLSDLREDGFPKVVAVVDHPVIRPDGTMLSALGFDERTNLYITEKADSDAIQIPDSPTPEDALQAGRRLLEPLASFPFVENYHRGVALAAIITAVLRPVMGEAPAFIFNAPLAGTGKTYLAQYIGAISLGEIPATKGPASLLGAEAAKEIITWVKDGLPLVLIDNWKEGEPLGSPDLDMLMTSGRVSKRQLGVNESINGQLRALFMVTGNNVALHCDMTRRVLMCRLDAQVERPKDRIFIGDPLGHALENRGQIISDVLTVVQAWFCANSPKHYQVGKGKAASFGVWDDLARQPVCWLKSLGLDSVDDPLLSQGDAEDVDVGRNNTSELIRAIYDLQQAERTLLKTGPQSTLFGCWASSELLTLVSDAKALEAGLLRGDGHGLEKFREEHACKLAVADALASVLGGAVANDGSKARSLGAWLSSRKDAPYDGLVLRMTKSGKKSAKFEVLEHISR